MMSQSAQPHTATPRVSSHQPMHAHPFGAIALGLFILFFALWGITARITTTEAWFLHNSLSTTIAPHFSVLLQPWEFFQGNITGIQLEAFTVAWGIEVLQFFLSTGLLFAFMEHNRVVSWICIICIGLIMILGSVTDYLFNVSTDGLLQATFALVVFMMDFALTYAALHLIIAKGFIAAWRMWVPVKWHGWATGLVLLVITALLVAFFVFHL